MHRALTLTAAITLLAALPHAGAAETWLCGSQPLSLQPEESGAALLALDGTERRWPGSESADGRRWEDGADSFTALRGVGTLVWDGEERECVLLSREALAEAALTGAWQAVPRALASPSERAARLVFGEDGRLTGNAGCNSLRGTWTLTGAALEISPLATTRMLCNAALNALERGVLAALEGAVYAGVEPEGRVIIAGPGGILDLSPG